MNENREVLNLDYYEGSDGPRLIFWGPIKGDFDGLQQLFRSLSRCCGPVEFHQQTFIRAVDDICLHGLCHPSLHGSRRSIRRRGSENGIEFEWTHTAEEWDDIADLIDGLVNGATAGHHYLSAYPNEDAIVVVSKGE